MFPQLQVTAVWMTAIMLFVQSVCPGLVMGCGCQQAGSSCSMDQAACCCGSGEAEGSTHCPHCNPPAEPNESEDGFRQHSVCHCGDFAPVEPVSQSVPEATTSLEHLLTLIVCTNLGVTTILPEAASPTPPPVPSSEELTHNYKQVVLCVWLT